jgi:glycerophosphoryl diester phosphodiesterase
LGLLYTAIFTIAAVAALLFEQAGVMVIAASGSFTGGHSFQRNLRAVVGKLHRIVQLGAAEAALLAVAVLPLGLLAVQAYVLLLSQHDIHFYLKERPPAFWLAAGIGTILLVAALGVGIWLCVRWALALPIVLFENQGARAAMRASRERVRGVAWRVGIILLGWLIGVGLFGIVAEAVFRLIAGAVLAHAGATRIVLIIFFLLTQGTLVATLSFILVVGLGLIIRQLYVLRCEELGVVNPDALELRGIKRSISPWNWRIAWLSLPLFLLAPLALWISLSRYTADRPLAKVTAHRGHARAAPENTLSAMQKAIESGADYVEMDVQLTRDGRIVLLHDRDLKRVAGDSRRLNELSYDEVRRLDVGRWFAPAFSDERVPTLAEVIKLCRGKIRMNIELKVFGPDLRLAQAVAALIHEQELESECIITSLNYESLQAARRHDPRMRTGLIVAHALGDLSRLDVDALSVRTDFLSDALLRSAHRQGKEVHVWTVNDQSQMLRLMKRGVDNIITSDPDLAISARRDWADRTGTERFVMASRLLLGLEN